MKKLSALTLSAAMLLSLSVGCSSGSDSSTGGTTGGTTGGSTGGDTSNISVGQPFGSADSPVEVTIIMKDVTASEESTLMLVEAIEAGMAANEQYVKLTYMDAPSGTYADAVPVAVRTGQISPDIIYFQGGDSALSGDDMLVDLTPYLAQSTHIKNLMQPAHDERMASYPYLLWLAPNRVNVPMIRGDYMEYDSVQAVMDDPSVDNYVAMYKDLVAQGVAEFGFTADGNLSRLDTIFNQAFGVTGSFIETSDGFVSHMVTEANRDKLAFYADLYAQGLIDPEYVTNEWDTMEAAFFSNRSATMAGTGGIVYVYNNSMTNANGEDAALMILPPADGVAQGYTAVDVTKESRGFAINADSEVKNEAFAVLEFMASDAGRIIDKLGIQDVHYVINEDGTYETTDRYGEWWARIWDTFHNFPEDIEFVEYPVSDSQLDALSSMDEYYVKDMNVIFSEDLQPTWDALVMLHNTFMVDVVTGAESIDSFDDFVAEWYAMGGESIHEFVNSELS
ncbi:MAG: extracellular solute-binding protein [Eubacteriales bacterium]